MLNKIRQFNQDRKAYGLNTALYNVRFEIAYRALGAKSMRVSRKR